MIDNFNFYDILEPNSVYVHNEKKADKQTGAFTGKAADRWASTQQHSKIYMS